MDFFSSSFEHLHLLKHPFYQAWMAGELGPETLRHYATQYFYHVDRFPRYLSTIHSMTENPLHRKIILENLNEEEGTDYSLSHPDLWLQFAEGLGVTQKDVESSKPCKSIQNVSSTFFKLSRSSFQEGLGALFAYESQIPEIAESKIKGLQNHYSIQDSHTLQFFEVHKTADVEHRKVLLNLLNTLTEDEKKQAQTASLEAAQSLWDFLTEIYEQREYHV